MRHPLRVVGFLVFLGIVLGWRAAGADGPMPVPPVDLRDALSPALGDAFTFIREAPGELPRVGPVRLLTVRADLAGPFVLHAGARLRHMSFQGPGSAEFRFPMQIAPRGTRRAVIRGRYATITAPLATVGDEVVIPVPSDPNLHSYRFWLERGTSARLDIEREVGEELLAAPANTPPFPFGFDGTLTKPFHFVTSGSAGIRKDSPIQSSVAIRFEVMAAGRCNLYARMGHRRGQPRARAEEVALVVAEADQPVTQWLDQLERIEVVDASKVRSSSNVEYTPTVLNLRVGDRLELFAGSFTRPGDEPAPAALPGFRAAEGPFRPPGPLP